MKKRSKRAPASRRRSWKSRLCGCLFLGLLALVALMVVAVVLAVWLYPDRVRDSLEDARTRFFALGQTLQDALPEQLGPARPGPEGEGSIDVWFAPVRRGVTGGLDEAFLTLVDSAQNSCYCALYDLEYEEAARRLVLRHQAGVDVRIVTDSQYEGRKALKTCMNAGIPVVFDNRNPFMHNKFCVVDGRSVWTGSTNMTFNGIHRNNNTALLIRSRPLAENYRAEFSEMFDEQQFGAASPAGVPHPVVYLEGGIQVETLFAPEDDVAATVVHEIDATDKTIDFMAFSFTSRDVADAMNRRAARGVKVRGLFEKRNAASQYSVDERLQQWGAEILLDGNPDSMHHKVIVLDGDCVLVGSYNFSSNADKRNDENLLVIRSEKIAEVYTREFERLAHVASRQP